MILLGIYNQQFQGTIILIVFDFQGYCTLEISLPKTNKPLKIGHPKRKLVFQPSIFRRYVCFREGKIDIQNSHVFQTIIVGIYILNLGGCRCVINQWLDFLSACKQGVHT